MSNSQCVNTKAKAMTRENVFSNALAGRTYQYDRQFAINADLAAFVSNAGPIGGNKQLGVAYTITLGSCLAARLAVVVRTASGSWVGTGLAHLEAGKDCTARPTAATGAVNFNPPPELPATRQLLGRFQFRM